MSQLDLFEEDIRSWVAQGFKQEEIIRFINLQGHKASLRTLQRRIQEWGIQVNAKPLSDDTAKQLILQRYFHKKHYNTEIASRISSQISTKVTGIQVKNLRLENTLALARKRPERHIMHKLRHFLGHF
jgi:ATP-dependent Zn protease